MAKRRKEKDEEEDKPFKIPKFDEEAFLKRERRNIKATFISFIFGCFMALICFGFWALMGKHDLRWELVLLVGVVNAAFLKYIFLRLNLDLTDFGRKNWFGSYAIYFFSWLIVFIIIVNPPFYDDEAPRVELAVLPGMQELGGTVKIVAKITDNAGMEKQNIQFDLTYPDGTTDSPTFDFENNIFSYTHQSPNNLTEDTMTYNFKITVKDFSDHATIIEDSFAFSNDTITLAEPDIGDLVDANDDIRFTVATDVDRVYYTVNDGLEINATKSDVREGDYITYPEYEGWPAIKNATVNVTVYAEVVYYFENYIVNNSLEEGRFSNTIVNNEIYYFVIEDDDDVGEIESKPVDLPGPRYVMAPGFEVLVFLISIVAVVLILKKRKKNRRNQK